MAVWDSRKPGLALPLGWEHVNLTGDYVWRQNRPVESRKFRPLRPVLVS